MSQADVTFEHPVVAGLRAVSAGLESAAADRVWQLSDQQVETAIATVFEVQANTAVLQALLLGEADQRDLKSRTGAPNLVRWLGDRFRLSRPDAAARVRQAGDLLRHRPVRQALTAGAVTVEQATTAAVALDQVAALPGLTDQDRTSAATFLLQQCAALTPPELARAGQAVVEALTRTPSRDDPAEAAALDRDQQRAEADAQAAERNDLRVTRRRGRLRAVLDLGPLGEATLHAWLRRTDRTDRRRPAGRRHRQPAGPTAALPAPRRRHRRAARRRRRRRPSRRRPRRVAHRPSRRTGHRRRADRAEWAGRTAGAAHHHHHRDRPPRRPARGRPPRHRRHHLRRRPAAAGLRRTGHPRRARRPLPDPRPRPQHPGLEPRPTPRRRPARPRLHRPRLRPPTRRLPAPPRQALDRRRTHRPDQRRAALPLPPPDGPPPRLDRHPRRQRLPPAGTTAIHRPRPPTPTTPPIRSHPAHPTTPRLSQARLPTWFGLFGVAVASPPGDAASADSCRARSGSAARPSGQRSRKDWSRPRHP